MKFNENMFLKDLETLVNIDSGSGDLQGALKMINFFRERFEALGFQVAVNEKNLNCPYIEARNFDGAEEKIDVLLMGHLDTVFPKGTAMERPFAINGERAHGPGVADMKSGALLAYYLAKEIATKKAELNLCVAFNSDEEIGSGDSIGWLQSLGKRASYCFNFEPGRENGAFVKKRKGVAEYQVNFTGIAAHAGVAPEKGASAILEMANWVNTLKNASKVALGTSVNVGIVSGGTASNVVAENCKIILDLRYELAEEQNRIEELFSQLSLKPSLDRVHTTWEKLSDFPPMNPNNKTLELIEIMKEENSKIDTVPIEFVSTGGASDANNLSLYGTCIIDGCGPIGGNYHSKDEYMVVSSIEKRFFLILEVIKKLVDNHN